MMMVKAEKAGAGCDDDAEENSLQPIYCWC